MSRILEKLARLFDLCGIIAIFLNKKNDFYNEKYPIEVWYLHSSKCLKNNSSHI
jgi:hypothetical protein